MKEQEVYVLGSVNTDMAIASDRLPEEGETMLGYDFNQSLGGKGCNQAIAAAKLGVKTTMIATVGRDVHGEYAMNIIKEGGVGTEYISYTDVAYTGTAIILRIAKDNRIILDQGANGQVTAQQVEQGLAKAQRDDFLLTQFEIPFNIVLHGLKEAKKRGLVNVVNPAPARAIDDDTLELIDIIVLNQVESEEITGIYPETELEATNIATWFFSKGIQLVVLTLGSGGSFAMSQSETIFTPAYEIDVVDTTGAGDAFIGTMLYGLSHNLALQEMLQYATGAGALACMQEGAQEGLPTLKTLQTFIKERE